MKCWNEVDSSCLFTLHWRNWANICHLRKKPSEESDILVKHVPLKAALAHRDCVTWFTGKGKAVQMVNSECTRTLTHGSKHKHTQRHNRRFLCLHFLKQEHDLIQKASSRTLKLKQVHSSHFACTAQTPKHEGLNPFTVNKGQMSKTSDYYLVKTSSQIQIRKSVVFSVFFTNFLLHPQTHWTSVTDHIDINVLMLGTLK